MVTINSAGAGTSTAPAFAPTLSGPYLTASAAYAAGFRGWPLVIMTAIAGRESSWTPTAGDPGDPSGGSYGLWQINGSHAGAGGASSTWIQSMFDPLTNAQQAFLYSGGNNLAGLGNWALTPPGGTSAAGVSQPNPYPWGTVPPAQYTQGLVNGVETSINYNLTATEIAKAIYAVGQIGVYGAATQSEMNGAGWSATGGTATTAQVAASSSTLATASGAGANSSSGTGCATPDPTTGKVKCFVSFPSIDLGITSVGGECIIDACQAKALIGGLVLGAGVGVALLGASLIVVAGFEGKGPLAKPAKAVTDVAAAVPGVGGAVAGGLRSRQSSSSAGPSEASVTRSDSATIRRESAKRETSIPSEVNYSGGRPRRSEMRDKSSESF